MGAAKWGRKPLHTLGALGSRAELVAWLYLLGVANGLVPGMVWSLSTVGFLGALPSTFGLSVVTIAPIGVGFSLALRSRDCRADIWDWVIIGLYLLGLTVPHKAASWAALTFFALLQIARGNRSSEAIAAASLFIGIAVSEFWGKLVLDAFAAPLLSIDAALVAKLLNLLGGSGVEHAGNLVNNPEGQSLAILVPCSSLSQISYGVLCWMTVVRAVRPEWEWADVPRALTVVVFVVFLNVLRMMLMGISEESYDFLHGQVGAEGHSVLILLVASIAGWRAIAASGFAVETTPRPSGL